MSRELHLDEVLAAAGRIQSLVRRTPLVKSPRLAAAGSGASSVHLKLESLQTTGSFKVRGAGSRMMGLGDTERARGVITFSTGNHGKAVAFVASRIGINAVVCMSEHVPDYRADAIRACGAEVIIKGQTQDEAEQEYFRIMDERGLIPVVPFDNPEVIAGQGSIALEMLAENPELDTLLVPVSGGGLLAGIAMTAKLIKPSIRVVGVSISQSPAMFESLKAGRPVAVDEKDTLADSLLGGIGAANEHTLPLIRRYADDQVLVDESEIERGMFYALDAESLVIEGAAAVGIAAVLAGKVDVRGRNVGLVLTGSSIDLGRYLDAVAKYR